MFREEIKLDTIQVLAVCYTGSTKGPKTREVVLDSCQDNLYVNTWYFKYQIANSSIYDPKNP